MGKRVYALDMIRGALMVYIILLHPLLQRVFGQDASQFGAITGSIPIYLIILLAPLAILALWGTMFLLLTGVTSAYSFLSQAGNSLGNTSKINQLLKDRILNSLLVLICNYFWIAFLTNPSHEHPIVTHSLITGWLETGTFNLTFLHMLTSSVLEAIAFTTVLLCLIFYVIFRRVKIGGKIPFGLIYKILLCLAIGILVISLVLNEINPDPIPVEIALLEGNDYFWYWSYMRLYGARFSFFPSFAFGCFGAMIGTMLVEKRPIGFIIRFAFAILLCCVPVFVIYILTGWDLLTGFVGDHTPFPLHIINLGLQLVMVALVLRIFDFNSSGNAPLGRLRMWLDRYSSSSLTIFIIEPFISIIYYQIFYLFYPYPFITNFLIVVVYLSLIQITWFLLLRWWSRKEFKYSFEFFIKTAKNKILKNTHPI